MKELKPVFDKLCVLIAEMFCVDEKEIFPETLLEEDLYADEFDYMELAMILEEEFEIKKVDPKELSEFQTVGEIVKFVLDSK